MGRVADDRVFDWEAALATAYRVAYGVLRDAALAEEVAQHACVKALAKRDSFDGRCPFPAWVGSIAFHLAIDERRRRFLAGVDPDEIAGSDDPERMAIATRTAIALADCLARLTERQRMIFLAKHLHQMKGAEIAAEMAMAEGTVWATLHQAAANLRECLERRGIDRRHFE
jgi:RNA polymerase sigma-70 factor (ECF subfamily)